MKKQWLSALGCMTYGIYVLTVRHGDVINGMIASWVSQVSYDPPLIMAAVHPDRYSHTLIEKSRTFALHVLDDSQKQMLKRFKGPDPEKKFTGVTWKSGKTGAPLLTDCLAWLELKVKQYYAPGNHTLYIAQIVNAGTAVKGSPLCTLSYNGMYLGKD